MKSLTTPILLLFSSNTSRPISASASYSSSKRGGSSAASAETYEPTYFSTKLISFQLLIVINTLFL